MLGWSKGVWWGLENDWREHVKHDSGFFSESIVVKLPTIGKQSLITPTIVIHSKCSTFYRVTFDESPNSQTVASASYQQTQSHDNQSKHPWIHTNRACILFVCIKAQICNFYQYKRLWITRIWIRNTLRCTGSETF